MKAAPYTTQLQAGLGLIDEMNSLLELWEPKMSSAELNQLALESGRFSNVAARRLRNIVMECFAPRYLAPDESAAKWFKLLQGRLLSSNLKQLMFLYTCRANQILAEFVREVYWSRYEGGYSLISKQDALDFVNRAIDDGKTSIRWSDSTIKRMVSYLLGCCADFGLLGRRSREGRDIESFRIESSTSAYLAYELHFQGLGDNAMIAHPDWQLYGLEASDVRDELKQMALKGLIIFQAAGSVTHIGWNYKSMQEVVDVIAES